jgi:hypothetical protein
MWFEETVTVDDAIQLFDEIRDRTYEIIVNLARELLDIWPPTANIPITPFEPQGVVVHASRTPSMWNSMHLLTRNVYGTHFLIMSGRHTTSALHDYPMLRDLPSEIFMPFHPDQLIQHSGYISSMTYGIELRSVGRLRPYLSETKPPPIMPIEECNDVFTFNGEEDPELYMPFDSWREKFEGPSYSYDDMFYELPTRGQIITMIALMKALKAYSEYEFDKNLIIPSNCVRRSDPVFPGIPWDLVRKTVIDNKPLQYLGESSGQSNDWIRHIFTDNPCTFEAEDIEFENDGTLGGQLDYARWRAEMDDGHLLALFDTERTYTLAVGYKRSLAAAGYHVETPEDCNFAMQLYAVSRGISECVESDVYSKLQQEFPL